MDAANDVISPLPGLPRLPVAELPAYSGDIGDDSLQWKTRALVRSAAGRPFVWVDDVIGDADRSFVKAEHAGEALLHEVWCSGTDISGKFSPWSNSHGRSSPPCWRALRVR
ncbi:hypothetical protein [Promicromonospora sp. MEB111]|uniref:hypothetical protein n=1 Tax=Promicromonospora sp. MEB111 TaxID=3040301 RepID=UPI0025507F47|nr:hypothetical protein [Promicromonospora sp. MEB111]